MTLRVAFQMDPMESVDIDADTTFALAEVAAERGMELFEYSPEHLAYNEGKIDPPGARESRHVQRANKDKSRQRCRRHLDAARPTL